MLHKEMQSDPSKFLPNTHDQAVDQIEILSLEGGTHEAAAVARRAAEILGQELSAGASGNDRDYRRAVSSIRTAAGRFLTAIGVLRALDFLRHLLFGS